jgi:hypothetical protein
MADDASMTVDAGAIKCPYAPFGRYPGKRGFDDAFLIPTENPQEESMPNRKAIHETPREIPETASAGARHAGSLPGRRLENDWFAYKGRPAARPAPPLKAPAPAPGAPKQTPAPAPDAPEPPAPAKEADAGQGPQK